MTLKCTVRLKFRYVNCDIGVTVKYHADDNTVDVYFDEPARAVTPGQALVLYMEKSVLVAVYPMLLSKR